MLETGEHYPHRKVDERIGILPEELRAGFAYDSALASPCWADQRTA